MHFELFIIILIIFIWYIYITHKTKEPVYWNKEGVYNPYNTYYILVKLFGNPDAVNTESGGIAIWNEDNLSDHLTATENNINEIVLKDNPEKFLTISFSKVLTDDEFDSIKKKIPSVYDSINKSLLIQGNSINEIIRTYHTL